MSRGGNKLQKDMAKLRTMEVSLRSTIITSGREITWAGGDPLSVYVYAKNKFQGFQCFIRKMNLSNTCYPENYELLSRTERINSSAV